MASRRASGGRGINAVLMLLGAGLLLTGADLFGYSHEVAVAVLFAGVVILGAVAIRVVHGLPPDSSPW